MDRGSHNWSIRIFVSYSHKADTRWFQPDPQRSWMEDGLIPWLAAALREKGVKVWYDRGELECGDDFEKLICTEIDNSRVAILIVSTGFLTSDFIKRVELPRIKDRARQGELVVIPILAEPCHWDEIDLLSSRLVLPGRPKTLIDYIDSEREWRNVRFHILDAIRKKIDKLPTRDVQTHAAAEVPPPSPDAPRITQGKPPALSPSARLGGQLGRRQSWHRTVTGRAVGIVIVAIVVLYGSFRWSRSIDDAGGGARSRTVTPAMPDERVPAEEVQLGRRATIVNPEQRYETLNRMVPKPPRSEEFQWPSDDIKKRAGLDAWGDWRPRAGDEGVVVGKGISPNFGEYHTIYILKIGEHYVPISEKGLKILAKFHPARVKINNKTFSAENVAFQAFEGPIDLGADCKSELPVYKLDQPYGAVVIGRDILAIEEVTDITVDGRRSPSDTWCSKVCEKRARQRAEGRIRQILETAPPVFLCIEFSNENEANVRQVLEESFGGKLPWRLVAAGGIISARISLDKVEQVEFLPEEGVSAPVGPHG